MKKITAIIVFLLIYSLLNKTVLAESDINLIEKQLNFFDFTSIDEIITNSDSIYNKTPIYKLIVDSASGELDLSLENIINMFLNLLFGEIFINSKLIKQLLGTVLLGAVIKNLCDSFKNKGIGELGFYVTYLSLILLIIASFYTGIDIVKTSINNLSGLMQASMPFMMGLLAMSGNVTSAYIFSPIMLFVINVISALIQYILAPAITLFGSLQIINYLTEKEILTKFAEMLKDLSILALKGLAVLLITVLSLQKISAPILNNLAVKTTKFTVSAIPVVGSVLNEAVDTVIYFTSAAKSASLVAIVITIIGMCMIPAIKLLAIVILFKFLSAVIQPISDKRIVECLGTVSTYTVLLLGCLTIVTVMFIFGVLIMLSF